jgi:rubrerythrin
MELSELDRHILELATLKETRSPVISCYLDLCTTDGGYRTVFDDRVQVLRRTIEENLRCDFEQALCRIQEFLGARAIAGSSSLAIFSRAGERPLFLPLSFAAPLPNRIAVSSTASIYDLVELKDNYNRYAVLLATERSAHILGINLGSVIEEIWRTRPDLRRRSGHEWTKEHYQNHRRERTRQFIHEQIRLLDKVVSRYGYAHIILAGNSRATSAIKRELPKHLALKLIDVVPASGGDHTSDIVAATLQSFLEYEEGESLAMVDKLWRELNTHGLAAAGTAASMDALRNDQVDVLVLAKTYQPGSGWACRACGVLDINSPQPDGCPKCRNRSLRSFDVKEEMVRMAERGGCGVEVVDHSDRLLQLGGAACLLRYRRPAEQYSVAA